MAAAVVVMRPVSIVKLTSLIDSDIVHVLRNFHLVQRSCGTKERRVRHDRPADGRLDAYDDRHVTEQTPRQPYLLVHLFEVSLPGGDGL